ncbi:DoxX family protein [Nocardioides sp. YIM 152315]|uniref:DoxX family protein n=1 Tax=Nocardioides sp. YIM 152315 TaxID=3031760 RepID=UPI0023DC1CDF|nr:DoxX family protein [Nocardioides sp. YIM 152315]MDF1602773.1 DoxX family protein [Nocardioides sp. YIM 152315]
MDIAYVTVTAVTAALTAAIALAGLAGARFVTANMEEVGVPTAWVGWLSTVKLAGAVGLGLGLAGAGVLGTAAASGLVLFFVGAVVAHVRARVLHNVAFPALYLGLSTASWALAIGH